VCCSKRACSSKPALRPRVLSTGKLAAARKSPDPVAVGPSKTKMLTAPDEAPADTIPMLGIAGRPNGHISRPANAVELGAPGVS
jgi:hypothetical protein